MQSTIQLRISPTDAANASVLLTAIAQHIGRSTSQINGYHILKQSIDARSRQQVWINLTLQVFIEEPVSERLIEPDSFPILPKNAKEVHIIGAGPAGLFAALECIQLGLRPIVIERGKDVRSRRRDLAKLNKEGIVVVPVVNGSNYVRANLIGVEKVSAQTFQLLAKISDQLLQLNASFTAVKDEHLLVLSNCKQLKQLELNGTAITNKGLASLTALENLESLSITQTKVTADGIGNVSALKKLKKVYFLS